MPEFKEMTVSTENGIKKAKNPILIKHLFEIVLFSNKYTIRNKSNILEGFRKIKALFSVSYYLHLTFSIRNFGSLVYHN